MSLICKHVILLFSEIICYLLKALEAAAKHRLKVLEQTKIEHIHMTNIMDLNLLIEEKLSIVSIQNVGTNLSTCRNIDRKHQVIVPAKALCLQ